jgi:hypothetical protein
MSRWTALGRVGVVALLLVLGVAIIAPADTAAPSSAPSTAYVFTYFTGNGDDGLQGARHGTVIEVQREVSKSSANCGD